MRIISKLAIKLSSYNIFVENKLAIIAKAKNKYSIISYGVDFENIFFPLNKQKCRKKLNLDPHIKLALFSSSFDRIEKNYPLAKKSAELVDGLKLIELRDYKRHEVNLLLNACDLLLMTSTMEGSPQVIKEAMACNCPIVTTDVGDVRDIIGNTEGCYITSYNPKDVASKIKKALEFRGKTKGREKVMHFDINIVTKKIINIYEKVISEYNKDHIKNQN